MKKHFSSNGMGRLIFFALLAVGAGCGTPLGARAAEAKEAGLQAWWRFEETAGTQARDSSGRGRDAVCRGDWKLDGHSVPGKAGKALQFDGGNKILIVPGYRGVTGAHARTVYAWVKTRRSRGEIVAWGKNDFGKMWTVGFIRGHVGVSPRGGYYYMRDQIHDGKWHQVAVVLREGDPPWFQTHGKLYLDGEVATVDDIGLLDLWPLVTGEEMEVRIGRGFAGALDELRIYDRALSAEEIKALYQKDQAAN